MIDGQGPVGVGDPAVEVPKAIRSIFEGPCALIAAGLDEDGAPFATWAWGAEFSDDGRLLRLAIAHPSGFPPGAMLAATAGDLPTLRSFQLKGAIVSAEDPTPDDRYRAVRHIEGFRLALEQNDGVPRERTAGLEAPQPLVTHVVEVRSVFDQSPGPDAGLILEA